MRKKLILLAVAAALLLSVALSACGGGPGGSGGLTFATYENSDPNNSYTKILPVWAELEKRTGVKITFDVAPGSQYNDVMGTRLAAGVNLPDIVRLPSGDPLMYTTTGLIIPIDGLIEEHAPSMKDLFDNQRPDVKKTLTAPDGHIYFICSIVDARSEVNQVSMGIRKDWLAKLGIAEPDDMEDWYQALLAFKNDDPNGNGQPDEIPLICTGGTRTYGLFKFGTAYGLHLSISDGWYFDENGKVVYEWVDPRLKDYLTEMNRWYAAGLIDVEFTTQTSDQYTAKAIGDIGGADVSAMSMQYPQWNVRMQATIPGALWEGMIPAAGKDGTRYLERENPTAGDYYGITKDCKDPVAAIKWLDYMYASEEGQILLTNFGIEGQTFDMVDGEPMLRDSILSDERGSGLAMESLGMNGAFPHIIKAGMIEQRFMHYANEAAQSERTAQYFVPPFPIILATDDESSEYASVMADINTLRDEYIVDFITGRKPLDEFDAYVGMVNEMGIDRAVAIRQAQYDRYLQVQ